jgi:hypothetical protein
VLTTFVVDPQTERVRVAWDVSGGCAPYSGTITARVVGQSPHRTHIIKDAANTVFDFPPPCAGTVEYVLTLTDSTGRQVTGSARTEYGRDCG